jgi:hypothetical protein
VTVNTVKDTEVYTTGDTLGVFLFMKEEKVEFYKNGRLIARHMLPGEGHTGVHIAVSLCNSGHQITILKHTLHAE